MKTEETFNSNAFFPGLLVVPVKTDLSVKRQFVVTTRDHAYLVLLVSSNASVARHQCLKAERRRRTRSRRKTNRIKQMKEWQPRRGKRTRGRPSRRWQDDITEKEGTTWIRKATDRQRWKTLMEGYILQWMDKA